MHKRLADFDLVIKGGSALLPSGLNRVDIGVRGETIAAIDNPLNGKTQIDAAGLLILPGGIDMHVHLTPGSRDSVSWVDDFSSGSRAAAVGGITTLGNMSFPGANEDVASAMLRYEALADNSICVDYLLHPVLSSFTSDYLNRLDQLALRGYASVKIFMTSETFERDPAGMLWAMRKAKELELVTMIHCEDHGLISFLASAAIRDGNGALSNFGHARPVYTESVAVYRAIAACRATGAPTYIVHLSSGEALAFATRARHEGLPIYVETRPLYLFFAQDTLAGPDGPLYTGMPPLRTQEDQQALWLGLSAGDIDCCCSDHAPWLKQQKLDPAQDVSSVRPGVPELQTFHPILFSEGVRSGRLTIEQFVDVTSRNAARIFGLYPQKGAIAVGSDADLVIWDPEMEKTVTAREAVGNSDYTPYEGWRVTGWPVMTIRRGAVIADHGRFVGEIGSGRRVKSTKAVARGI